MLAAAVFAPNDVRVSQFPEPEISEGEALLRVGAVGLCQSDLKIIDGFLKPPVYPLILGHEIYGSVVEFKARNKDEEHIAELGKRGALVYFYIFCGACVFCRRGKTNLCVNRRRLGFELNGGYAEYVAVPISNLVPTSLPRDSAILCDAGATMFSALNKVPLGAGDICCILGIGGLGSMGVQIAKYRGCRVIALDKDDSKLAYAKELGADLALNVSRLGVEQLRGELERGIGLPQVFVDLVGNNDSQRMAVGTLERGGYILQVGYSQTSYSEIRLSDVVYNEFKIVGSLASTIQDLKEAVRLAEEKKLKLTVTKKYGLKDFEAAISDLRNNKILGRGIVVT